MDLLEFRVILYRFSCNDTLIGKRVACVEVGLNS